MEKSFIDKCPPLGSYPNKSPPPPPRAKARMQKPQGGGKFFVQIPGGARRGMVMDEIDTCITRNVRQAVLVRLAGLWGGGGMVYGLWSQDA